MNRAGTWEVRGIKVLERKKMVDAFRNGMFELFGLTETKMKGDGEISWCGVSGICGNTKGEGRLGSLS